ncbi:stage III sporulation protein AF [Halonatronum saccharophilum]|uniref:stage III sporulation protein AF n=1 Tax=Halonatronum saccharophilum TaxID=150060 RepID=UPI0004813E21|nr:stage III sporulation protein AF [Halonatronum saccharophilum]
MNVLRDWVRNIVLVILFANFIEILLPNSQMRKYVKVVMGFFIILVILNPLLSILEFGSGDYNIFESSIDDAPSFQRILSKGERMREEDSQVRSDYKLALSKQIRAIIRLNTDVENIGVDIELGSANNIEQVVIRGEDKRVIPVEVNLEEEANKEESKDKDLKELIASLYGLSPNKVKVYLD